MTVYRIRITEEAERDLLDIFDYIARKDSLDNANHVLDTLEKLILSLDTNPKRGHTPPELEQQGIKGYKEVHFKPYRIIYEIIDNTAIIHACFDGRRDIQSLLQRRLLR